MEYLSNISLCQHLPKVRPVRWNSKFLMCSRCYLEKKPPKMSIHASIHQQQILAHIIIFWRLYVFTFALHFCYFLYFTLIFFLRSSIQFSTNQCSFIFNFYNLHQIWKINTLIIIIIEILNEYIFSIKIYTFNTFLIYFSFIFVFSRVLLSLLNLSSP